MAELSNTPKIHRGLKDVYFERSATTFIDGKAGELRYRGYSIHDLAQHSTFEETAYLLLHGELPKASSWRDSRPNSAAARQLPPAVLDIIAAVQRAHPMDVLRTAVSALSAFDPETGDKSRAATLRKGIRLTAQFPTIVAAHRASAGARAGRARCGPLATPPTSSRCWRARSPPRMPRASSTSTSSCTPSTAPTPPPSLPASSSARSDMHAAVTAAIAALSGPAARRRRRGRAGDDGGDRRAGKRRRLRASASARPRSPSRASATASIAPRTRAPVTCATASKAAVAGDGPARWYEILRRW